MPLLQSLSTEDEPVAPLKSPREESKFISFWIMLIQLGSWMHYPKEK